MAKRLAVGHQIGNNLDMRLSLALVSAALFALTASTTALAKVETVTVCGESGCATITEPEDVNALALYSGGYGERAEPEPAPFFTVTLAPRTGTSQEWSFLYVPSARAVKVVRADFSDGITGMHTKNDWVSPGAEALAANEQATESLTAFPATDDWVVSGSDGRDVPWLPVVAALAAMLLALLLLSRRIAMRRVARPALD